MKKKLFVLLLLAIIVTSGFAQGLYSDEGEQNSLFGEPVTKEDPTLRVNPGGGGGSGFGDGGTDAIPVGESIMIFAILASAYTLLKMKKEKI
jgi:hypothetical protein